MPLAAAAASMAGRSGPSPRDDQVMATVIHRVRARESLDESGEVLLGDEAARGEQVARRQPVLGAHACSVGAGTVRVLDEMVVVDGVVAEEDTFRRNTEVRGIVAMRSLPPREPNRTHNTTRFLTASRHIERGASWGWLADMSATRAPRGAPMKSPPRFRGTTNPRRTPRSARNGRAPGARESRAIRSARQRRTRRGLQTRAPRFGNADSSLRNSLKSAVLTKESTRRSAICAFAARYRAAVI
jgi:hypothetical protein